MKRIFLKAIRCLALFITAIWAGIYAFVWIITEQEDEMILSLREER